MTDGTDAPQALLGFRTNEEWSALVAQAGSVIDGLDGIADEELRRQVFGALDGIDAIHREALHRLVRLFDTGVLEKVVTDPAIRTLMGMYDLLPPAAPGCARVWDFLPKAGEAPIAARHPEEPPHWTPAPLLHAPSESGAVICQFDEGPVLIADVRGEVFAADARCPHHGTAMHGGTLSNFTWVCPHGEGCIYDVRSGARLGGGASLSCLAVRRDERGRVLVGFGIPFEPHLPAF